MASSGTVISSLNGDDGGVCVVRRESRAASQVVPSVICMAEVVASELIVKLLDSVFEVGSLGRRRRVEGMHSPVEGPMAAAVLHRVAVGVLEECHTVVVAVEATVGMARGCIEERLLWWDKGGLAAVLG